MSSLLEQAIVDASALKEAATKNAEKNLIDKYSHKIKEAVDKLLEQDISGMDQTIDPTAMAGDSGEGMDAASSLENVPSDLAEPTSEEIPAKKDPLSKIKSSFMLDGKDDELITIDFSSLKVKPVETPVAPITAPAPTPPIAAAPTSVAPQAAAPAPMQEGLRQYELGEDELAEELGGDNTDYGDTVDETVEIDLSEEEMCEGGDCGDNMEDESSAVLVQVEEDSTYGADESSAEALEEDEDFELEESLIVDMQGVSDGWRGAQPNERRELENVELARLQDEEVQLKIREYEDAIESTNKKIKKATKEKEVLMKENIDLKEALMSLKEHVEKMNISNAKLLYMNRVLGSNSFNERQKEQIVETISKTSSVEGAKIAYEALQSSVQSVKKESNTPKSLNEAVSRSSSPFLVRKTKETSSFSDRMKMLAGIKN